MQANDMPLQHIGCQHHVNSMKQTSAGSLADLSKTAQVCALRCNEAPCHTHTEPITTRMHAHANITEPAITDYV